MRALAKKLKIHQGLAIGIMEALWHWASETVPDGGVGKFPNVMIADSMYWPWPKRADELIEALVDVHYLDEMTGCRLYIHDWHVHCEDSVNAKLARSGLRFANQECPKLNKMSKDEKARIIKEFYQDGCRNPPKSAGGCRNPPTCAENASSGDFGTLPMPISLKALKPVPLNSLPSSGQDPEKKEIEAPSANVAAWREAWEILKEVSTLAGLKYEHVVNAANSYPDVPLVEECKKMAVVAANYSNSLDNPGVWVMCWLRKYKPEKKETPPQTEYWTPEKALTTPSAR
jgi:hypothetical protein